MCICNVLDVCVCLSQNMCVCVCVCFESLLKVSVSCVDSV